MTLSEQPLFPWKLLFSPPTPIHTPTVPRTITSNHIWLLAISMECLSLFVFFYFSCAIHLESLSSPSPRIDICFLFIHQGLDYSQVSHRAFSHPPATSGELIIPSPLTKLLCILVWHNLSRGFRVICVYSGIVYVLILHVLDHPKESIMYASQHPPDVL